MSSYNVFASFYDRLTQNVEYEKRSDYILKLYDRFSGKRDKALDLACGTGSFSLYLSNNGFDVTGIDLSEEMLCIADSKAKGTIDFICGDMTDFSLNEKYDLCICCLDSINHITDYNHVKRCFDCVHDALYSNGIFIFDVNTVYKHKEVLADNTFVFDEEDFFLSWDNELVDETTVRVLLDFFVYNGKNYDRYSEEFYERAYTVDALCRALSGFEILGVYEDMTLDSPKEDSERIYFVCKRKN